MRYMKVILLKYLVRTYSLERWHRNALLLFRTFQTLYKAPGRVGDTCPSPYQCIVRWGHYTWVGAPCSVEGIAL